MLFSGVLVAKVKGGWFPVLALRVQAGTDVVWDAGIKWVPT